MTYECTEQDRVLMVGIFNGMDVNGDDRLSREELKKGLPCFGIKELSDSAAEDLFKSLDTNEDGYISLDEFFALMAKFAEAHPKADKAAKLRRAFLAMDTNKDGALSEDELYNGMKRAGVEYSREEVSKLAKRLDKNRDGRIEVEEFISYYNQ